MITVSNTSTIHYLILIQQTEILPKIFDKILIPGAVAEEMGHPKAPIAVKTWIAAPPSWASIRNPKRDYVPESRRLGKGEIAAIALAIEENADALLTDDRDAIKEGWRANLTVLTTFSVLELAAIQKLIDFEDTLEALTKTTFRMPPVEIINEYLERNSQRRPN